MKRALLSVFHKTGVDEIASLLTARGWEIISTGGTAKFLKEKGIAVRDIKEITGFPEILDGRVKTLHPLVFAPILAKKSEDHLRQLEELQVEKFDLVMVNFYPFEEALSRGELGQAEMVEQIDVGGPAMVRAAAKNFRYTTVVVDEQDYRPVAEALARDGDIPLEQKQALAFKAFSYTSFYDALIAGFLGSEQALPAAYYTVAGRKVLQLRYGENPHQLAALYIRDRRSPFWQIAQLQGKELSFNNLLDLSMSYELLNDFQECPPLAVIVKHQNPCGAALAESQPQAFHNALAGDPQSAFGGIVGFNRVVEGATAQTMKDIFLEVVIAPGFVAEALEIFKKKKNLRLIQAPLGYRELHDVKTIPGGFVFQTRDQGNENSDAFALKTERPLTPSERADVAFGWKLVKYVKSNAIIIVKQQQLLGVGAGQMSRVDAVELAIRKSRFPLAGAVLLSDAFFPFPDSIDLAAAQKISVIVEPGGSVKDGEVIATAAAHGLSLLFTSVRHFRH